MHRPDLSGADCEVTNGIGGIIFNIFTINLFLLIRLQEDGEFDYNGPTFGISLLLSRPPYDQDQIPA